MLLTLAFSMRQCKLLHAVRNGRDSLLYEDGQLFHGSFPTLLLQIDAISKPRRLSVNIAVVHLVLQELNLQCQWLQLCQFLAHAIQIGLTIHPTKNRARQYLSGMQCIPPGHQRVIVHRSDGNTVLAQLQAQRMPAHKIELNHLFHYCSKSPPEHLSFQNESLLLKLIKITC